MYRRYMQNFNNNNIEQLIIGLYIINYLNGDYNYKKILNTKDQANRFEILNLFESYHENMNIKSVEYEYSKNKLAKGIQKAVYKIALKNLNLEKNNLIYSQMMFDIKSKLSKILGIKNFVILDESFNIQDLLVSYLFRTKGEINFKTNDTNLFSQLPKVSDKDYTNIINTEKNYEFSDNIIYYIPNLNKNNLDLIKDSNFIIDLKDNIHNINGFKIVCLENFYQVDSTFRFEEICKLWSTLFYLGINSIIN